MLVGDVSAALFEKINRCLFFSQEKGCKAEMLEGCFASKRKDVRVVCYVRKSQQEANPSLTHKPFAKHCQTKKSGNVRHQTGGLLRFVSQGRVLDISSVFSFRMLGKDQQSKVSYKFSSGSHYKFKKVILTT